MMTGKTLTTRGYARLRDDVAGLLESGRRRAEAAVGSVLAETYWAVGRRLLGEGLTERAGYGDGVVEALAEDLSLSPRTLHQALRFGRLYEAAPQAGLTWSHYRELIGVGDSQARAFYESRVLGEGLAVRALSAEIRADRFGQGQRQQDKDKKKPAVPRPRDGNWVYLCEVARVIDGDTIEVLIDLGFDVVRRQVVRLVHVDAAEAKTAAGRAATAFVRKRLAEAQTVALKTAKLSDARGRFVAYVFYSGKTRDAEAVVREGRFLNGELVREGHAKVAMDRGARLA